MLEKLKKLANNASLAVKQRTMFFGKTEGEIIEEIHESFYSEMYNLLREANILHPDESNKAGLLEKYNRLKNLGFVNSKEVMDAKHEIERMEAAKAENEKKKDIAEAINYFGFKYPMYRFITEESVIKICAKYNLVYGSVEKYTGTVPDRNLKHIENFKIDEIDKCHELFRESLFGKEFHVSYFGGQYYFDLIEKQNKELEKELAKEQDEESWFMQEINNHRRGMAALGLFSRHSENRRSCPLEIVAPLKDFNMSESEIKNFKVSKIEIPDPVVLCPVFFKGSKHYLIVTAWGPEASDELVVNANHN